MVLKRFELRQAVVHALDSKGIYYKTMQEYPICVKLLGEMQYDTFRFPSHGGLFWSRVDIALPQIGALCMTRPLQHKFTDASARLFNEEWLVLEETTKVTQGYNLPLCIIDDNSFVTDLSRYTSIRDYNFVLWDELPTLVLEATQQ